MISKIEPGKKRNIDFDALRSLRQRHGHQIPKGEVVFREGDTSNEFYVILQGRIELSINAPDAPGGRKILVLLEPGDFVGEMSAFTGLPRSATAVAIEDCLLLSFDQTTAISLLRASPRFALGIIQTLCDRVRGLNDRLAREAGATGPPIYAAPGQAPSQAIRPEPETPKVGPPAARVVPPPEVNKDLFWLKSTLCPSCRSSFQAINLRPTAIKIGKRESDLREIYTGPNLLWYQTYTCPVCFYSAYPDDFEKPKGDSVDRLATASPERIAAASGLDLAAERGPDHARFSVEQAINCYRLRVPVDARKIGSLYHRHAWLEREKGDAGAETAHLRVALDQYREAHESGGVGDSSMELLLDYLIGELHLRLGEPIEAIKWFAAASQLPEFKKNAEIARLTRDRWTEARDLARRPAAAS